MRDRLRFHRSAIVSLYQFYYVEVDKYYNGDERNNGYPRRNLRTKQIVKEEREGRRRR